MLGGKALIVGAARNCAPGLEKTLPRLERFQESFDQVDYFFVTNDSEDATQEVLMNWASDKPNVEIMALEHLAKNVPQRTARLAVVRNICLSRLQSCLENGINYDYFIVIDLDGVNADLVNEPSFSSAIINAPPDWSALFANQRTKYYDIWALRHNEWCPGDCWQDVKAASRGFFRRKSRRRAAVSKFVTNRQINIPKDAYPVPVNSAFGGLGIYRAKFLEGGFYVGLTENGREICEHVSFHSMIKKDAAMLYILPHLLNDAPLEHVRVEQSI
ncbi:hypothetical protein [Agrobacterium rosae]